MLRTLDQWLTLIIRVVAVAGLLYEILADHLHNPTAIVVFGGLAGLPDVLSYRSTVRAEIKREEEQEVGRRAPGPGGGPV